MILVVVELLAIHVAAVRDDVVHQVDSPIDDRGAGEGERNRSRILGVPLAGLAVVDPNTAAAASRLHPRILLPTEAGGVVEGIIDKAQVVGLDPVDGAVRGDIGIAGGPSRVPVVGSRRRTARCGTPYVRAVPPVAHAGVADPGAATQAVGAAVRIAPVGADPHCAGVVLSHSNIRPLGFETPGMANATRMGMAGVAVAIVHRFAVVISVVVGAHLAAEADTIAVAADVR